MRCDEERCSHAAVHTLESKSATFGVTSQNVHSKSSAFGLLNVYVFTKRCTSALGQKFSCPGQPYPGFRTGLFGVRRAK